MERCQSVIGSVSRSTAAVVQEYRVSDRLEDRQHNPLENNTLIPQPELS